MDGVNLNASEQNVHHSNGADLVASLFAGVTQQSQHEAGMHRLHFPSPPEFIGIPLQENSFVVNGLLDGGIPHYPDPGAAAGGHQYTHAPHPEEPIRWDYFGSNCEPGDLLRINMIFQGRFLFHHSSNSSSPGDRRLRL